MIDFLLYVNFVLFLLYFIFMPSNKQFRKFQCTFYQNLLNIKIYNFNVLILADNLTLEYRHLLTDSRYL